MGSKLLRSNELPRREFLRDACLGGLGAVGLGLAAKLLAVEPYTQFPTSPRSRLAVTSYPFGPWIESPSNPQRDRSKPGMDLKDFAAMIVKRFGVHNINPLSAHFRSTDPTYIEGLRRVVARAGSHIVGLGLSGARFWDSNLEHVKQSLQYGKRWIDIAVALGSPSVRQHLSGSPHAFPDLEKAAQSLGRLAEYGAKRNVAVNLENDNLVNEDPFFIVSVINKVDNPYLRALPDFGNSIRGHDAAYNQRAVAKMFQHAFNMAHVKDRMPGMDGKVYRIDLGRMFSIAKSSGYRGYFSMEWEDRCGDPFQNTERLINESLRCLA